MFILKALGCEYTNVLWNEILCDSKNLEGSCWKNKCEECMNGKKLEHSFLGDENVSWNEWRKNVKSGKLELCVNQDKKSVLRKSVFDSLAPFQQHVRIKRVQAKAYETDKKDDSLSVLHFDFAMAYSAEYQNEVQSALWSRASVNIFTALFYNGQEKPTPYIIVTDSTKKDKDSIFTFVSRLLDTEKEKLKKDIAIYSDGPSSEFKNRFMVSMANDFKKKYTFESLSWKYFASSHGELWMGCGEE